MGTVLSTYFPLLVLRSCTSTCVRSPALVRVVRRAGCGVGPGVPAWVLAPRRHTVQYGPVRSDVGEGRAAAGAPGRWREAWVLGSHSQAGVTRRVPSRVSSPGSATPTPTASHVCRESCRLSVRSALANGSVLWGREAGGGVVLVVWQPDKISIRKYSAFTLTASITLCTQTGSGTITSIAS